MEAQQGAECEGLAAERTLQEVAADAQHFVAAAAAVVAAAAGTAVLAAADDESAVLAVAVATFVAAVQFVAG